MEEKMENKSVDELLGTTKELLSLWMTTYPNVALNTLSPHESMFSFFKFLISGSDISFISFKL